MSSESLSGLLDYARSKSDLTAVEERELQRRIQLGDKSAKDRLVSHNMRLAFKLARGYAGSGMSHEDMVQEALVGLSIAADKFDPDKGRFTTYATRWIKKCLYDAAYGTSNTIKRPSRLSRTVTAVRDYVAENPSADIDEITEAIKRPRQEVVDAMDSARVVASTSDEAFKEVGVDEIEETASLLETLDPEEREAISWKHGLYGQPRSLFDVAEIMTEDPEFPGTYTQRDVARLCRSATRKLRAVRDTSDNVICSEDE